MSPGTKLLLKLLITHKAAAQTYGGFDVSATGGTLAAVSADSSVQALSGEVTHTAAKAAVSGVTEFQFNWTAPTTPGTYSIRGAGNSVNKAGGSSGDMYALASSLSITVQSSCADADGDGAPSSSCGGTDCNDSNASINPSASEICDNIDNDCDTLVDDSDSNVSGQKTYYRDADGDGFGTLSIPLNTCASTPPSGYTTSSTDCNDAAAAVNPSAQEICNSVDDDCDAKTDDADPSITGQKTYFRDADGDGFGTSGTTTKTCASTAPSGYSTNNNDCNDSNAQVSPNGQETCNSIDDDCDTLIDDSDPSIQGQKTYFRDADGDTFGNANTSTKTCSSTAPTGFVTNSTDCNDGNAQINPSAQETCNSVDDDCDALVDDADTSVTGQKTYYADVDVDGFGNPSSTKKTCSSSAPTGYVTNNTDCNDADRKVNPSAQEVCNGIDDDCDAKTDDADSSVTGQNTFFADVDKDGYGSGSSTTDTCSLTAPTGYSAEAGDCNDADATINPRATEICDSKDNDCDGLTDDADSSVTGQKTYYQDADSDGFGNVNKTRLTCSSTAPVGYVTNSNDCNDSSNSVNPSGTEVCGDGIDQDCNGVDLGCGTVDADKDGYTPNQGDCDDTNVNVHPGVAEICGDGIDQDCAGGDLSCLDVDNDQDTYTENQGDCDDEDDSINPDGVEIPYDGIDQDCDDSDLTDVDSDGFDGGPAGDDCNDNNDAIRPDAAEICGDGIDNNCDGSELECPTPTPEPITPTPDAVTPTSTPDSTTPPEVTPTLTPGETPTETPGETPTETPDGTGVPATETPGTPSATETPTTESPTPSDDGSDSPACSCNQTAPESRPALGGLLLLGLAVGGLRRRRD